MRWNLEISILLLVIDFGQRKSIKSYWVLEDIFLGREEIMEEIVLFGGDLSYIIRFLFKSWFKE